MSVTSRSLAISSRARFHPTFPAPAMITYICSELPSGREHDLLGLIDGVLRWTDRVQALLGVPGGAGRIGHPHHDPGNVEAPLGELGDDEIGVVTPGGGHEHVGVVDAGSPETIELECRPDGEPTAGVLPAGRLVLVEPLVRERITVEYGDFVARLQRSLGDR